MPALNPEMARPLSIHYFRYAHVLLYIITNSGTNLSVKGVFLSTVSIVYQALAFVDVDGLEKEKETGYKEF